MDSTDIQLIEKHLEFIFEENRLATFKSWIFSDNHKCNASKMAEAGFIFIGNKKEPDSVKCFLRDKSLDGWDEDDDPWQEHLSHSSNCSFAKLQTAEQALTILQLLKIKQELIEILIRRSFEKKRIMINKQFDQLEKQIKEMKRNCKRETFTIV